jgi:CRP/FNR family cyclic AMP-dependent transcriptional regulator
MLDINLLLERGGSFREFGTGEIIFNQGTSALFYYQLISGRVRWSTLMDNGNEVLYNMVEPGQSFGELPIFDGFEYAASAIAEVPSKVIRLRIESFQELLAERADLYALFTRLFAERLRYHFFLSNILSTNSPEYILTSLIGYFNKHGLYICQDCNRLMLTRQQLANIAGLRVETVIRTIKQLQSQEKLEVIKGKVIIPSDGL